MQRQIFFADVISVFFFCFGRLNLTNQMTRTPNEDDMTEKYKEGLNRRITMEKLFGKK